MTDVRTMVAAPLGVAGEYPSHEAKLAKGGFHIVKTLAERDAIWDALKDDTMVVHVIANDDGEAETYKWNVATGKFEPHELTVQAVPAAMISAGMYGDDASFNKGNSFAFEFPFKVWPDDTLPDTFRVSMKHGLWQIAQAPNYLAYLDNNEEISGKVHTSKSETARIWCDDTICPAGPFIQLNRPAKTIGLQEADDKDPNVTGGMDYQIAFIVGAIGTAPEKGFIRACLYDETNKQIATDLNGHLLGMEIDYSAGDSLRLNGDPLLITGIVDEKGLDVLSMRIEDTFKSDKVILGDRFTGPTGIMVQALTADTKSGDAMRQFELDTGIKIRNKVKYQANVMASLGWILAGIEDSMPVTWGAANQGMKMNNGWDFHNLTVARMGVKDGYLTVQSTTANKADENNENVAHEVCDFYFGKIENNEDTEIMRGHTSKLTGVCKDTTGGLEFALVYWDGTPDKYTRVFDSRNNGTPVLNTGWHIVKTTFDPEEVGESTHSISGSGVVPVTATNYGWITYPAAAEAPVTIQYKDMRFGAQTPFNGVAYRRPVYPSERAIAYHEEKGVFAQDNEKFQGLRYTLVPKADGVPLPCGELVAGALDIEIDKSVNVVVGSGATGGEGAFKFKNDGIFHNYYTYVKDGKREVASSYFRVTPGEALKKAGDTAEVKLWWSVVSDDGQTYTKIDESETTYTVKYGDNQKLVTMKQWSDNFEGGDRIALRGSCSVSDGAFLVSYRKDTPLVNNAVYYKELVLVKP